MKKHLFMVVCIVVSGCSSFGPEKSAELRKLIEAGECQKAYALAQSVQEPIRYNNMGAVAFYCEKDKEKARNFYEFGARMGERTAMEAMSRNGWAPPINYPTPQQQSQNLDAALNSAVILMNSNRPAPIQPMPAPATPYKTLTGSHMQNGNRMCRYSDGSIVNMGLNFCPFN